MWKNPRFTPILLVCFITCMNAQNEDLGLYLDFHIGIGHVLNLSDQTAETFSIDGRPFATITGGNIETFSASSPFVHIGLTKPLSSHWSGGLFIEYLFDNAELFGGEQRAIIMPISSKRINTSFPAKRKLRWFNLGVMVYYHIDYFRLFKKIGFLKRWDATIGTGLIAAISKHYYRTQLMVDFNSNFDISNKTEVFSDTRRKLAGVPIYFRYNFLLNDKISLNAGIQAQIYFRGDFLETGWFMGLSYQLE